MANLKRRNHYLPECYQLGFSDSSGHVWVKFPGKTPQARNPNTVGRKRSLYIREQNGIENDKLEDFLTDHVETPFAALSQRIKAEANKFSNISGDELGALYRFTAAQAVRTLAHWECIEEQAGRPIDGGVFTRTLLIKMKKLIENWINNPPVTEFYTSLNFIGSKFITGDHPVMVMVSSHNPIWTPTSMPKQGITNIDEILMNPSHSFILPLSPYVTVRIRVGSFGEPVLPPKTIDPVDVNAQNELIRGQCNLFILGNDEKSVS